jgi:hypothetical protein
MYTGRLLGQPAQTTQTHEPFNSLPGRIRSIFLSVDTGNFAPKMPTGFRGSGKRKTKPYEKASIVFLTNLMGDACHGHGFSQPG